ncbi:MAG TPA: hypothetical protein VH414_06635 [Lichenihabitans sp.]|nr:hypothetical protein [Lichenihabitans sp.]
MRRPHVFERSAPRSQRPPFQEPSLDAARRVAEALPELVRIAEAGGQATLAYLLTLAKLEAESAARRAAGQVASNGSDEAE